MKGAKKATTVRRSIAGPRELFEELTAVAPPGERENINRLILTAIRRYIEELKNRAFAEEMTRMAADPDVRREIKAVDREFRATEMDGLK